MAAHHIVRWHARKLHESLLPKRGVESAGLFRPPGGQALQKNGQQMLEEVHFVGRDNLGGVISRVIRAVSGGYKGPKLGYK